MNKPANAKAIIAFDVVVAFVLALASFPLAVAVPVICLFAKWDGVRSWFSGGDLFVGYATVRGDLPRWAYVWSTPDERLPGDVRMPQTRSVLEFWTNWFGERFGRYMCSVWWLLRNRALGLKYVFSRPVHPDDGYLEFGQWWKTVWRGRLWRWRGKLLRVGRRTVYLELGWEVRRATPDAHWQRGPFCAIPEFAFKAKDV